MDNAIEKTTLTVYQTDENDIYLWPYEADPCQIVPVEYLIPQRAYKDAPPPLQMYQAARRTANKSEWEVIADYRGYIYHMPDGTTNTITNVGITPPTGCLTDDQIALKNAKADAAASMSMTCTQLIVGGFKSNATGTEYTYPSSAIDQTNLLSETTLSVNAINTATEWACDLLVMNADSNWVYVTHTAEQIVKVSQDFSTFRVALLKKKNSLIDEINAITDPANIAQVSAIVWN
jgi:hypothetical protein